MFSGFRKLPKVSVQLAASSSQGARYAHASSSLLARPSMGAQGGDCPRSGAKGTGSEKHFFKMYVRPTSNLGGFGAHLFGPRVLGRTYYVKNSRAVQGESPGTSRVTRL